MAGVSRIVIQDPFLVQQIELERQRRGQKHASATASGMIYERLAQIESKQQQNEKPPSPAVNR